MSLEADCRFFLSEECVDYKKCMCDIWRVLLCEREVTAACVEFIRRALMNMGMHMRCWGNIQRFLEVKETSLIFWNKRNVPRNSNAREARYLLHHEIPHFSLYKDKQC